MNIKKRAAALGIIFAMILLLIPPLGINVSAADAEFSQGAVVLGSEYDGKQVIIHNGVYSVTVHEGITVEIIFNNVTIDHSNHQDTASVTLSREAGYYQGLAQSLYAAGGELGWARNGGGYYVPTCPFHILGNSNVSVRFDGNCVLKAGIGARYLTSANATAMQGTQNGIGHAGIQVESGSTLIINGGTVKAYGGYQKHAENNVENNALNQTGILNISGMGSDYGGGAGIGGGSSYNNTNLHDSTNGNGLEHAAGTPGNIIINNGNILAVGGYQGAGIGGGANGAATTGKIEINGGIVTAQGGMYAAGIGEGDSLKTSGTTRLTSKYFNSANGSYEVIINAGTVTANGGYQAGGIGTTDNVSNSEGFGTSATSGLEITITGGNVTARSGSTNSETKVSAAIGTGYGTNMRDNSITIYNQANIVAASFSYFAISNYGTDITAIPSVNIDPEGYVYLARFDDIETERVFEIYAIHKNANGHFMYVPTAAYDIADGSIDRATTSYYYAYDPGHVSSDGTRIGGFYLVDADGANVVPTDYAYNQDNYLYDEDTKRYYPTTIPAVSAYYDVDTVIEDITVPGNYKAVAITLPKPDAYGGAYVLEVPQSSGNPIYVLMQKDHPGVTSGEIQNSSQTHYSAGNNPPPAENSTPNIVIDGTARPFTDLDVGIYEGGAAQPTLIPDFVETVYGYTFYVPHGTEKFWLDFSFASSYTDESGSAVSAKLILVSLDGVDITPNGSSTSISLENLDIDESGKTNVWIKKTDTVLSSGSTKTVSYKVTIVVKDKYTFLLNVDALDKVYDGNPVEPSFTALLDGAESSTTVEKGNLNTSYSPLEFSSDGVIRNVSVAGYDVYYTISDISLSANGTVTYTVKFTYYSYTTTYMFTVDKSGNISFLSGDIYWNFGNNYRIFISNTGSAIRLQLQQNQGGRWNTSGGAQTLNITTSISQSFASSTDLSAVEKALKNKIQTNGTTSESLTVYGYEEVGTALYNVTLGAVSDIYTVNYTSTGNATVTVTYSRGTNLTSQMTQDEIRAVVYTFYEDSDGDGVYETLLGTQAPKNAGRYLVTAVLEASKYEAEGSAEFIISKKEIHIVAIENWLKYITSEEVKTYDGTIPDPGEIYFDGVVSGETVALQAGASFRYVDKGNTGYADDISYDDNKIIIMYPVLNAASQVNYLLVGVTGNTCYVHGQIAYSTSGTMFRKADAEKTSLWRKFYPVEDTDYLTWITSGGVFTDTRVDYHSPVPNGASADNGYSGGTVGIHREYVKLRTTGDTSERYSVDIEFGAMQFEYTKTVWNVNTGEYEAVEGESRWNGHNGSNNAVTVTNRSNSDIYYQLEFAIDFMYAAISEGADSGIRAALYDANYALIAGTQNGGRITSTSGTSGVQYLLSAAPSDPTGIGTARSKTFLLVLSGVPSSITEDNNINYTNVGTVTVTIVEP